MSISYADARLPALAAELARCLEECLGCLERDELELFDRKLDERSRLLTELHDLLVAMPQRTGIRSLFGKVLDAEARLKSRVETEHARLTSEIQQVGVERTNLARIAEAYTESEG